MQNPPLIKINQAQLTDGVAVERGVAQRVNIFYLRQVILGRGIEFIRPVQVIRLFCLGRATCAGQGKRQDGHSHQY